jgi:uncharacterized protein (DUF924 family)
MDARAKALLDFWFGPGEAPRAVWFEPDPAFDAACGDFLADHGARRGRVLRFMG